MNPLTSAPSERGSSKLLRAEASFARSIIRTAKSVSNGYFLSEVSHSYAMRGADGGYSWSTARNGAKSVQSRVPVSVLSIRDARQRRLPLRSWGSPRLGQHYLWHESQRPVLESVAQRVALPSYGSMRRNDDHEWVEVKVRVSSSGRRYACCPFHTDTKQSVQLWQGSTPGQGGGVCFGTACMVNGTNLRMAWREVDGKVWVRKAVGLTSVSQINTIEREPPTLSLSSSLRPHSDLPSTSRSELDLNFVLFSAAYQFDRSLFTKHSTRIYGTMKGKNRYGHDYGMEQRSVSSGKLIELLRASDRRAIAEADNERVRFNLRSDVLDSRQFVSNKYIGMDPQIATHFREFRSSTGKLVKVPKKWSAQAVTHVLVDLDRFTSAPVENDALEAMKEEFVNLAKSLQLTGEVAVVRTSHLGLQMVFGLPSARTVKWFEHSATKAFLAKLDAGCLSIARRAGFEGGEADIAVHYANRYMRRPGARIDKRGEFYVSRLVLAVEGDSSCEPRRRKVIRRAAPKKPYVNLALAHYTATEG